MDAESERCDTEDRYTLSLPGASEHSESQLLDSSVQKKEGTSVSNKEFINAHQPRETKRPDVNYEGHKRPAPQQIGAQRRHSERPAICKKNFTEDVVVVEESFVEGSSNAPRRTEKCITLHDDTDKSPNTTW